MTKHCGRSTVTSLFGAHISTPLTLHQAKTKRYGMKGVSITSTSDSLWDWIMMKLKKKICSCGGKRYYVFILPWRGDHENRRIRAGWESDKKSRVKEFDLQEEQQLKQRKKELERLRQYENDEWMGMVGEERFWPGNTSFPAAPEFGRFARDDFT